MRLNETVRDQIAFEFIRMPSGRIGLWMTQSANEPMSESKQHAVACDIIRAGHEHPDVSDEQAYSAAALFLDECQGFQINGYFPALRDFLLK